MNILKPLSRDEISREDSVIIGVVGFLQSFVTITLTGENIHTYRILIIVSFFIFVITRGIAIIRNSWKLRSISLYSIISMFIIDITIYVLSYLFNSRNLSDIINKINIPIDVFLLIFMFYIMMLSIQVLDKIIENRYLF